MRVRLAEGQIYEHRDSQTKRRVVVGDLRLVGHPKAMHVDCALAVPAEFAGRLRDAHPFDVDILAPDLPNHGDGRWKLVEPLPPLPSAAYRSDCNGYDLAESTEHGWRAVPSWGREGWDLGSWPLVVIMHRTTGGEWWLLEYVEGDLDVREYRSRDELAATTDRIAAYWWRQEQAAWIAGIAEGEEPEHLRGAYHRTPSVVRGS